MSDPIRHAIAPNGHAEPNGVSAYFDDSSTPTITAATAATTTTTRSFSAQHPPPTPSDVPPSNLPHGDRSLSSISLRSFLLGQALSFSILLTLYALRQQSPHWRTPFLLGTLALFHFLEFYTTAYANTSAAKVSAFLLRNGPGYAGAQVASFVEAGIETAWLGRWRERWGITSAPVVALGLMLAILGQSVRTLAMLQCGTNFNHVVQKTRKSSHRLVTHGVYSFTRHPAYFGYFWWAVGTQIALGNVVCAFGFALVLWDFFRVRIKGEEGFLLGFFGAEYGDYKERTGVGIPFIR